MFGDPVTNPRGWDKLALNELCDFKKTSVKPEEIKTGDTYIGLECIEKQTGKILERFIVEAGEIKSNKFWFDSNYILYGKLRPYLNKVANPDFEGVCSTDIIPIRPVLKNTAKEFIISLLRGSWFVSFADERCSGANLPRISPKELEKYQTINPPIKLQNQFAERVKAIEAQKAQAQASLAQAEDLFNSLLQRAFKGKLV
jgi:type I restriction enzyme S subunit